MTQQKVSGTADIFFPQSPFVGEGPKGDPANLNEIVAGVDFRSENDFRVPVYNEKGNLLMNPSFESGCPPRAEVALLTCSCFHNMKT